MHKNRVFRTPPKNCLTILSAFSGWWGEGGCIFGVLARGPPGWGGGYGYTPVWGYPESVIVRPPQTPKSMVRGGILGGVDFKGFGTPSGEGGGGDGGGAVPLPHPPRPPPPPRGVPRQGGPKTRKKRVSNRYTKWQISVQKRGHFLVLVPQVERQNCTFL